MTDGGFRWGDDIKGLKQALSEAEHLMRLAVSGGPLGKAAAELIGSGGKRLRPRLALAAAAIGGGAINQRAVSAAAAVELVHLASLIHDDIIDKSSIRRGLPSVVSSKGQDFALLAGDFLIAKALTLALDAGESTGKLLAGAISQMAESEIRDISFSSRPRPLSAGYFDMVQAKTASLFAAAARSGAICARLPAAAADDLGSFGEEFGMVFQLVDDLADGRIGAGQASAAVSQIDRRCQAAKDRLKRLKGPAADSLRCLPESYMDWASPL